jgi:hypothetical protein
VDDWVIFRLALLDNEGLREDAIEVCRIVQGQETCHVGFLQRSYVAHFQRYSGRFAQVREIWSADDESATQRSMFYHNHGCCVAGMMGPNVKTLVNYTSYDNKSDDDNDTTDSEQD